MLSSSHTKSSDCQRHENHKLHTCRQRLRYSQGSTTIFGNCSTNCAERTCRSGCRDDLCGLLGGMRRKCVSSPRHFGWNTMHMSYQLSEQICDRSKGRRAVDITFGG